MRFSSAGFTQQSPEGEKGCLNSELWHACAGPLVSLPAVGSRVVYFPQGHSEQVGLVAGLKLPITLDELYYIVIDFTRGIEAGIAVIGHVGLTPQAISVLGGFRAQGKNIGSWVLFCCSEMCAYTCCCCCNICSSNPYHRYWGRNFL
ncbi:uncharacterized protein LOC114277815 isoform X5 [Camellia sinensis]|uniref:uncharacterized protein LOC114277815 isoform X5 n=1 Tax=Camellia sinensis TaxID=4442 RepID=UPI0010369742|nr:uncharacterized protein LOC114277815 isoform X5 [Camellia sinensis]